MRPWRENVGDFPDRPPTAAFGLGDDVPVYWINYAEAQGFCSRLTARAIALARRFVKMHPTSPHAPRLETLISNQANGA